MPSFKIRKNDIILALLSEELAREGDAHDGNDVEIDIDGTDTTWARASKRLISIDDEATMLIEDFDADWDARFIPVRPNVEFDDPSIWTTDYGTFQMDLSVLH